MDYDPLPKGRIARLHKALTPFGLVLWALGAIRVHRNGGGFSMVFRWYHPLNWLMAPLVVIVCGIVGLKFTEAMPFRLSEWWREPENFAKIEWL